MKPVAFIVDVDGVMTTGQFIYSETGKEFKIFGPDDHDALSLLKPHLEITFVTGDSKGFEISKKRIVDHMGFPLELVSTVQRIEWVKKHYAPAKVIFMGDGFFDHYVFREVGYAIAPSNAMEHTKKYADMITSRPGGDRAVAEACLHILEVFFQPYDPLEPLQKGSKMSGQWGV